MSEKLVVFMTPPYQTIYRAACNAIAGSLLIAVCTTAAAAKDSSEIGWTLKQWSLLQGDQELIACKYGVKMTPARGGQTYLFAPPYTNVQVWNQSTGKCCSIKMTNYKSQIQSAKNFFDTQLLSATPLRKVKEGSLHGLATMELSETPEFARRQVQRYEHKEGPSRIAKNVYYVVSNKFNLEPSIYRFVAAFYGFPYAEAMPLSFVYYDIDHDRKTQLVTGKITPSKFSPQQFIMPTGLKVVADEHKVAETAQYNEAIEMMLPGKSK